MTIRQLTPTHEAAFYALCAEYLPDSDPERMRLMQQKYPHAFLCMLDGDTLMGAAYGWPRAEADPADSSYTLDGIVIQWDYMKHGLGKQLLRAFEQAAARDGAPAVSVGSAGGYVEKFYLDCGYLPREYKVWQGSAPFVEHAFTGVEDYRAYARQNNDGFVVFEKRIAKA